MPSLGKLVLRSMLILILFSAVLVMPRSDARATAKADLDGVKTFLVQQCTKLKQGADSLKKDGDSFYELAQAAQFDYAALWKTQRDSVARAIRAVQADWIAVSPLYEQMEGIVAGVPFLSKYDPILDAGLKGETDYDVRLPDGQILSKPGNLFGLLETTLWGTDKAYIAETSVDFDGNGSQDFGEVMPNAVFLKGFADALAEQTGALLEQASAWEPTETDVFAALVLNLPTMTDFFNSWKTSRFVMGDKATHEDFVVISRLSDIKDNVGSWQVMWQGLIPMVSAVDAPRSQQIADGLTDLRAYVIDLYDREKGGKRFTPEEADLFAGEAQNRATMLVGQITQVAAELNIVLPQGQ